MVYMYELFFYTGSNDTIFNNPKINSLECVKIYIKY